MCISCLITFVVVPCIPPASSPGPPRVLSAQFGSFAKCISMLLSIVPTPSLITRPLFIIDFYLHIYLYLFIYACINIKTDRAIYKKSSEMILWIPNSAVTIWLKIAEIFTLDARIAFDKHREEFLQTHRRTFICRGATLGFTPTSHSARRRIGTHLYWRRMLYYLFVCGCGRRCRGFDFFQSVGNAEGVQVGASGVRSLRPGAGPVADREPIKRARVR